MRRRRRFRVPSKVVEGLLYAIVIGAPLLFGCVEPWSQALLELACFTLAFLCLFRPERGSPSLLPLLAIGVVLAIGLAQLRNVVSPLGPRPPAPFTVSAFATKEALLLWSAYAALAWSVPRVIKDADVSRRFARAVVVSGVVVALSGIVQSLLGLRTIYGLRYASSSPFGPYYNRDHAANLMAVSFAVAAGLWASRFREVKASWRAAPPDWILAQALTGAALVLLLLGIGLCVSRGAMLGLLFGGSLVVLLSTRFLRDAAARRRRQLAVLGVAALGVALAYQSLSMTVRAAGVIEHSFRERVAMDASGLRMLADSPLFGWGLGAVRVAFGAYQTSDVVGVVEHVHNDWLELALQCGLVGLAAVALLGLVFSARVVRLWWGAESREMRAVIGGGLFAAFAVAAHCLVDFASQIPANAALFFALAGWLGGASLWADKEPAPRGSWPRRRWALAPVLAALALAGVTPAIGAWYARAADLAPAAARGGYLAMAASWDPRPEYGYRAALGDFDLATADPVARPALMASGLRRARALAELEPLNPDFQLLLGAVLWQRGDLSGAQQHLEMAQRMRFDPIVPDKDEPRYARRQAVLAELTKLNLLPENWGRAK